MEEKWHTRKWFKENFGVDPEKLGLPFKTVPNPHYRTAAPMKLWKESDILPFKDEAGMEAYRKRQEAGKKAFQTRKQVLKDWFLKVKTENPRVQEILKRLWEIGEEISTLHFEKEQCREYNPEIHGVLEECEDCEELTKKQNELREGRGDLFMELEKLCGKDKRTI